MFPGGDAPKAWRHGIFRPSRLAINGRKRSLNGEKTVSSPVTARCDRDQLQFSAWRTSAKQASDISGLLVRKPNDREFTAGSCPFWWCSWHEQGRERARCLIAP